MEKVKVKPGSNFLSYITGLSTENVERSSEAARRNINLLGLCMLIVPAFSGLLLSFGISQSFLLAPWQAMAIFLAWGLFIYNFDRAMVAATRTGWLWAMGRLMLILALTILHATFFDTIFFSADLESRFNAERDAAIAVKREWFDKKEKVVTASLDSLQARNQSLHDAIAENERSMVAEANGTGGTGVVGEGPIFKRTEAIYKDANAKLSVQIDSNHASINRLEGEVAQLRTQLASDVDKLDTWKNAGLLTKVRLLHKIVFEEGDITAVLFSIVWLLMVAAIELLPLLAKAALLRQEYEAIQAQQSENAVRSAKESLKAKGMIALEECIRKLNHQADQDTKREGTEHVRVQIELIWERLQLELDTIEELQKLEEKAGDGLKPPYNKMAKDAVQKAQKEVLECFGLEDDGDSEILKGLN